MHAILIHRSTNLPFHQFADSVQFVQFATMPKYLLLLVLFCTTQAHAQLKELLYTGPPVFHGATAIGNYPNTDFIYTIPATGERPLQFVAQGLPKGLQLDEATGLIKGRTGEAGDYKITVTATNKAGSATRDITIKVGDKLCLTPAMGWNSWNVFTRDIDEQMLMQMADAMVSTGMRDLGYQYINIDDFWHADVRDSLGNPVADAKKFPHGMKYVSDYVHSKGLKLGIYSCAGNMTCGRRFGGYSYEEIDAKKYAEWGIDLLKYDYCYAPWSQKAAIERYTTMGNALKHSGRSIVFSVCEWGIRKPWKWAAQAGGSYWRSTPDIFDGWRGGNPFQMTVSTILNREVKIAQYAGPGHFNDPDMLTVGNYGKGKATSGGGVFKGMSDTEYQSHMSLWCLLAAPLLSSCDLRSMNEATTTILLNPELLDINQDELGLQAVQIYNIAGIRVFRKPLKDGSMAVGVLNMSKKKKEFTLNASLLGKADKYQWRDVLQHVNVGELSSIQLKLQAHQMLVFRVSSH